jgi:glucokinase
MSDINIVAVDIGGTSINCAVINNGKILAKTASSTPADQSKQQVLNVVMDTVRRVTKGVKFDGIGVGVPGLQDDEKGIVYELNNIPSWDEVHLISEFKNHFSIDVFTTNDANCYVLGEKYYGKGSAYESFVGITLGTGLGTGYFINGDLHSGLYSSAGEMALIPYLHHNYEYYCSGQYFLKEYGVEGAEIFNQAQHGNELALGIFRKYGNHLGHLIKHFLHILAPEAIFFGGSIKHAFPYFETGLWEVLQTYPYRRVLDQLVIEQSEIEDIALLGAAALFEMRSRQKVITSV